MFLWWTNISVSLLSNRRQRPLLLFQWEEERMFQCFFKSNALGWVILQHLLNEVKEVLMVRIMAGHEFLHEEKQQNVGLLLSIAAALSKSIFLPVILPSVAYNALRHIYQQNCVHPNPVGHDGNICVSLNKQTTDC